MIGALGLIGGKYRLVRELGRGAFGAVYAARLEPSGEPVAIKILARFDEGRSIERFRREVHVLSRIAPHPNIVRVFESGEHGGLPFVAMELVQGGSLSAALRDGRRPTVAQAARLAEQVALGLDHLHRSGVVHRDVNANNVLIDEGGNVRLVDFGLALDKQRVTRITETGELLGTPLTFAPEQLDGKNDAVGFGADIYATAALLYELLTGRSPFQDSKSFRELAHRIRTELPAPVDELNPQVPRGLARAVELGLAKSPEDRPRTAAELAKLIVQGARAGGSRTSTNTTRAHILGEGPRQVAGYELVLPLGRGRRGVVYSARRVRKGGGPEIEAALRVVAVSGELAGAFAQYVRVVERLARVAHPSVISVVEAGIEEGYGYCATELVRGETLRKVLERDRKLDARTALQYAAKVARGVAAVHAAGMFHGDLRAEDVLLDPEAGPKVGDFMLETVLARSPLQQQEGVARDIQALGNLLHEMLTGRRHAGGSASPRLEHEGKKGQPVARLAARIALRALDKDAQLRHKDAASFALECERATSGLSLLYRLAAWLAHPSTESAVERARIALGVVAALLLVVAGLATRSLVASHRQARGTELLERARAALRSGARPEEVEPPVEEALALLGKGERRLLEAGRLLLAAGSVRGASRAFEEAARGDSLEALYELDRTTSAARQCLEWAGEGQRKLVAREKEARAAGGGAALLEKLAEARLLVDRGTARAELLRSTAFSFGESRANGGVGVSPALEGRERAGETPTPPSRAFAGEFAVETGATRALLLLDAGEPAAAQDETNAAMKAIEADHDKNLALLDARASEVLFLRAEARLDLGSSSGAEQDLDSVLALVPGHARALALRSVARARRGRTSEAARDLAAARASDAARTHAIVHIDCARAAVAAGALDGALDDLAQAARLGATAHSAGSAVSALVALRRAAIQIDLGRYDDALSSLDAALESPRADLVALERARLHARRGASGDREQARADLLRALDANPRLASAQLLLGELEAQSGETERAIGRFEQAMVAIPWSSEPLRAIALLQLRRGSSAIALETLGRAIALERDVPENHALRAIVRLTDGTGRARGERPGAAALDAAIQDLDHALACETASVHPDRWRWIARRGEARLMKGDREGSLQDLSQALEHAREPWILALRAEARRQRRDLDGARSDLDAAIDLERANGGPRVADYERARRDLEGEK